MVVDLHPEALAEWNEAIAFYEERASGLGFDLFLEVERVLRGIAANPELGSSFQPSYRRVLCRRFPFSVVYRIGPEKVRVQAVMHQRRKPGYWRDRD